MASCGLYCGACGIYIATRDGNEKFRGIMADLYGSRAEETVCYGCVQPEPPKHVYGCCRDCETRGCVKGRGYYSCHQCAEWPCGLIENFELATGRRVMKRTVPR
jgi:hypothetical protein